MGLRINELSYILGHFARTGVPGRAITVGRMDVFVSEDAIRELCTKHRLPLQARGGQLERRVFFDELLRSLGAREAHAIDYSDFEGAEIVHDLGRHLPAGIPTYDLVYESGTLEHIYNFPVALDNIARLCSVGGRVILNTPCNNFAGHGFYQFSPELYFSAFRNNAQFEIESIELYEDYDFSPRWRVTDPKCVGSRVETRSFLPVNMTVVLRRKAPSDGSPVLNQVLQTDYVEAWQSGSVQGAHARGMVKRSGDPSVRRLLMKLDERLLNVVRWAIALRHRRKYIGSTRPDLPQSD